MNKSEPMNAFGYLSLANLCLFILACWLIFVTARTLIKAYRPPLSDIPGPWIAKFTRLWLMQAINTRSWDKINIRLHRRYGGFETLSLYHLELSNLRVGPIVRISPNEYSIDDPDAARIIYRTRDELVKVWQQFHL